ncbi:pyrroline-5-carboxylate reductase [Sporodiniella umbellata]|nr:pyrroline-5-carboxylate reductase [Sporodiniella umbellata]
MAEAILAGLQSNGHPPSLLRYSEPLEERRSYMQSKYPQISGSNDNDKTIEGADVVVLAVKPQMLRSVVSSASSALTKNPSTLIISVAAGMTTQDIRAWLSSQSPIVRCMPNTPSLIGQGAVGLFATENVSQDQKELTESIMNSIAKQVSWIKQESLMDTVTAISGSGPAYFFLMMESMQNAAVEAGLDAEVAKSLVLQTCIGAAQMARTDDLTSLRRKVTSPNGTTEAAIKTLEANQFSMTVKKAVFAAQERGKALGKIKN